MSVDTDFMDELEAVTQMKSSLASNLLLAAVTGLVLFGVIWASVSEIDEVVRGSGQVVPSREIQIVQSLEGGILAELLVHEGNRVRKGQILMRISDVAFASEERGIEAKSLSLRAKKARLEAESQGLAFDLPGDIAEQAPRIAVNEKALYQSRQRELRNALAILDDRLLQDKAEIAEAGAQVKRLKDNEELLREELTITQKMVAQKAVPRIEEIRLKRELSDISGHLKAEQEKLPGLEAGMRATQRERTDQNDKFRSQALGELNEVETEIAQIVESLKSIGDRVYRAELRAPVDGIVNKIMLKTIGGVVGSADKLIEIVPLDDELKIVAKVSPNDIAFLDEGQDVKVKITAYDPQRYGSLEGTLMLIGANSVTDRDGNMFFEIEVRTDKNYMGSAARPLRITPGMMAEIDIIIGKRTIMEYLLKPLLRVRDRALRER